MSETNSENVNESKLVSYKIADINNALIALNNISVMGENSIGNLLIAIKTLKDCAITQ